MIESLEAVVSAGPGGGVDESARRVAAKSPVECRRGGAKGGVAKSHGALVRRVLSSASAIVLPRRRRVLLGAGGLVREREVRGRFRGSARIAEET